MHPYLEKFIANFRDCPVCHFRAQVDFCLCEPCQNYLDQILKRQMTGRRQLERWDHQWLLNWRAQDQFIGDLLRHLKGGGLPTSFLWLARRFLMERQIQVPKNAQLVYPTKGVQDHGYAWAQGISQVLGVPAWPLKLEPGTKQALRSRNQREDVIFDPAKVRGSILFVDDVVTTGATARAAFRALGRPKNFAIWSIFYRPPL